LVNRQRLVRLRNRVGQVARTIRRPRCIRRRTELPLLFGLLRRRRLQCQRVRLQLPDSGIATVNRQRLVRLRNRVGQVARTIRRPRPVRRRTELPLSFGLLRCRRLLRQRVRLQFPDSGIVPVNRQRLVRLRNRVGQVARTIRRPRCIRRRTELPLPFGLLRRRRLLRQRVRLQFPDSGIVPVNRQRLVRLRNRVGQVARTIRRPPFPPRRSSDLLSFGLLRCRRLLRQRVRLQFPDSGIVPVNRQRLVRLRNRV